MIVIKLIETLELSHLQVSWSVCNYMCEPYLFKDVQRYL